MRKIFFLLFFLLLASPVFTREASPSVLVVSLDGTINPASANIVEKAVADAESRRSEALIIRMDTPGGLDTSMRQIIKALLSTKIPIIVYVAPSGARAASAGAFIALAADVAVMAPGTNIGAAHPVNLIGGEEEQAVGEKVVNDSVAYARAIAELKGKNANWAEQAVRKSSSLPASGAVKENVADFIAGSVKEVLSKLDGKKIKGRILNTRDAGISNFETGWINRMFHAIAEPNIAFLLLIMGIFGIIYEFANPGIGFSGVGGAIALLLAFFSLQMLPTNWVGVLLIFLGMILLVMEIFIISGGILALGGIAAFVLGALLMIENTSTGVSLYLVVPAALVSVGFLLFIVGAGLKAQRAKVSTGAEGLIGAEGTARTDIDPKGMVFVAGALWSAESDSPIESGRHVQVLSLKGLTLKVAKLNNKEAGDE